MLVLVIEVGIVIDVRAKFQAKVAWPMEIKEVGREMETWEAQEEKA